VASLMAVILAKAGAAALVGHPNGVCVTCKSVLEMNFTGFSVAGARQWERGRRKALEMKKGS